MGAATAAWLGESVREAVGCQHTSAVAIAALCSAIAQVVATILAAAVIAILGDSWRASVTPGLGYGELAALGRDTRKLVRKQSTKAAFKSVASRAIVAALGTELGMCATIACAIGTATFGGVIAAVSIETAQKRAWSSRGALSTAFKATYKTAIKTAIATSLKESMRLGGTGAGPVVTSALCCGTGIGFRNFIVDWLHDELPGAATAECWREGACPHRKQRKARAC